MRAKPKTRNDTDLAPSDQGGECDRTLAPGDAIERRRLLARGHLRARFRDRHASVTDVPVSADRGRSRLEFWRAQGTGLRAADRGERRRGTSLSIYDPPR